MKDGEIIRFRGLAGRTFEDQKAAMVAGYNSTWEYAFDELARMHHELAQRVDALEQQLEQHRLTR